MNCHNDTATRAFYLVVLSIGLLSGLTGCKTREAVFPDVSPAVTWPKTSATARIRYVGQLSKAADLKPDRVWYRGLGDFIFGGPQPQPLYGPRDVLVIDERYVWCADPGGRCLHLFDIESRSYQKITTILNGNGKTELSSPVGLCMGPESTVFACDSINADIYQFKADGTFIRHVNLAGEVGRPTSISWASEEALLFVLDTQEHNIKAYTLDRQLKRVIGTRGVMPGEFNFPLDILYSNGSLWVVDSGNGRVQRLDRDGKHLQTIGKIGKNPGDFALPKSIAMDSAGNIYVTDARFENIQLFNPDGQLLMHLGGEGSGIGSFSLPSGLFISQSDRIWVCDSYNHRLQVFQLINKDINHDTN